MRAFFLLLPALLAALPLPAGAETGLVEGDAAAGSELYASQCQACHGAGGNSLVPEQPIVAGQHAEYLAAQIRAFRDQVRVNAAMWPFVCPSSKAACPAPSTRPWCCGASTSTATASPPRTSRTAPAATARRARASRRCTRCSAASTPPTPRRRSPPTAPASACTR
ncbi:MAG: c-type cytochrome [Betaproteobacteria bacterium AqS2]|uniref:C-type cytochrome n=1 Tax=Candidatus Amphirhobacter heronislandensis TaxID=1732024 RepID=A0A930UDI7_9GAMM|nr:c-type cytochrome [Betaproteobacteria bacterium AqS2]